MIIQGVIFDLDLTLIDSREAEVLRSRRNWKAVYKMIPKLQPYHGIPELLQHIKSKNIKSSIVTSSPTPYCSRVIKHWNWEVDTVVCYHDTIKHKPHPAPMIEALKRLSLPKENVWTVGDDPKDIASSRAAGMKSVAAIWGCQDIDALLSAKPDFACSNPNELIELIDRYTPDG
jgi:HAD superfamily hydrolase (TIGR01549 family)